jgi:recombination protein RecA
MPTTTIRPPTHHQHDEGLRAALDAVAQQFGAAVVTSPNGTASTPPAVIPTGSLALDHALRVGGLPRGRVTEVYGPEGVGKTTLALSMLAQAQRAGGTGVFVDAEHALDLAWAQQVGMDAHKLLQCRPDSGEQALQVASVLIASGEVDVLVIDSVAALVPQAELDGAIGEQHAGVQANLLSQALRKLAGQIARANTAVVVTNQLRQRGGVAGTPTYTAGGRALGYYASVRLHLHQPSSVKDGGQVVGTRVRAQVVKNKLAPAWQSCELELHADQGLCGEAALVHLGLDAGLLVQRGAWLGYGTVRLGQGRQAARRYLRDHPELASQLDHELRTRLAITTHQPALEPAASEPSRGRPRPPRPAPASWKGTNLMSVVRQLAQAVLGLALLGLVVRLLAGSITDGPDEPPLATTADPGLRWVRDQQGGGVLPGGDVGGDAQLDESFSVRFHHRDRPGATVTFYYYAALDLDDLATVSVERQTELACSDPADPGGTEVWSDYRYETVQRDLDSVEAATAAARRAAEAHLACDEAWSGQPPWEPERAT